MRWITNLWNDQEDLIADFRHGDNEKLVKGTPKATDIYTSEQLEKMNLFGLYAVEIEEDRLPICEDSEDKSCCADKLSAEFAEYWVKSAVIIGDGFLDLSAD